MGQLLCLASVSFHYIRIDLSTEGSNVKIDRWVHEIFSYSLFIWQMLLSKATYKLHVFVVGVLWEEPG